MTDEQREEMKKNCKESLQKLKLLLESNGYEIRVARTFANDDFSVCVTAEITL